MNIEEIREAKFVLEKILKKFVKLGYPKIPCQCEDCKSLRLFIDLADLFLKVSEGGVEKLNNDNSMMGDEEHNLLQDYNAGFNSALDLCNAHFAGKLMGLEKIIENSKLYQGFQCKNWTIRLGLKKQLAQAIITELTKKD